MSNLDNRNLGEEEARKILFSLQEHFECNKENLNVLYLCLSHESWRVRKDAITVAVLNPTGHIISLLASGLASEENAGLRNACQEALTKIGKKAADYLVTIFNSSDKDVRKFILDILGDMGDKNFCDFLVKALKDQDENVVIAACENLGKIRCIDAVKPLLDLLDPYNQWLSFVILEALSQIGYVPDVHSIIPLWKVQPLRKPILDLMPIVEPEHTIEVFKLAFNEPSSYILENAALNLYRLFLKHQDSFSFLKNSLKDVIVYKEDYNNFLKNSVDNEKVYALCAYINESIEFFVPFLENASDEALEFFGYLSNFATFSNHQMILSLIDKYETRKQAYLVYLCGIFEINNAIPVLKNLCNSAYGHTRQALAFAFGKIGSEESINCLFSLLSDPYPDVREQAINALSSLIKPESFPKELASHFISSNNEDSIIAFLDLLANLHFYKKEYIDHFLKSPFSKVRAKTLEVISKNRLRDFLQEVLLYLTDEDSDVKIKAIEALGNIGGETDATILLNFIENDDFSIKKAALNSLYKLCPFLLKQAEEKIFKDINPLLFFHVLELLSQGAPFSIPLIIDTALLFDDSEIHKEVLDALSKAGKQNDMHAFIKTLQSRKGNEYVQSILPTFLERD